MSLESFIHAMPKVDLGLQFEGCVPTASWKALAEFNEIPLHKRAERLMLQGLDTPDTPKIETLYNEVVAWVRYTEDLTRLVYDIGVALSKENIHYAEIAINPSRYLRSDVSIDDFLATLTDGRDRVKRGWGVELGWVFNLSRDEARRADEIVRYANSPIGRTHGVVAVGLVGSEFGQDLATFERPMSGAERKGISRVARAGDINAAEGITEALDALPLNRIITAFPIGNEPEIVKRLADSDVTVEVALTQSAIAGYVASTADYPLLQLLDAGVKVTLTANASGRYHTTTSAEYLAAATECGASVEQIIKMAETGIRASSASDEEKVAMRAAFATGVAAARAEHLSSETTK